MKKFILFIIFGMNLLSLFGYITIVFIVNNKHSNDYSVNENLIYFTIATLVFSMVSLFFIIETSKEN
jgi:hypothetical protein